MDRFVLAIGLMVAVLPAFPQDLEHRPGAEALGRPCLACHAIGGHTAAIPSLFGMPEARFVREMRSFRDGTRSGSVMNRIARSYPDKDLAAMAPFFLQLRNSGR